MVSGDTVYHGREGTRTEVVCNCSELGGSGSREKDGSELGVYTSNPPPLITFSSPLEPPITAAPVGDNIFQHEPAGDISHSNHNTVLFKYVFMFENKTWN